jgi:hypothetical protein
MMPRIPLHWLALALLSACNPPAPPGPVRVQGDTADVRRLVGTWHGEFVSPESRRVGTIRLELRAGGDTAYGSVTFDHVVPTHACTDLSRPQAASTVVLRVVLRIGALATDDGNVGGWLSPYRDPDLGCWMDTWFTGRLRRDTLQGTFFSRRTDTVTTVPTGSWWATRTH